LTSRLSHADRNSSLRGTHSNTCNTAFILVFYLVNIFKKLKAFLSQNSFLTTTAECSFKCLNTQCSHALFKLKRFIFILKHTAFKTTLITKETSITALPCPLHAVFTMCFVYKGHAHQLCGFTMTSTAM